MGPAPVGNDDVLMTRFQRDLDEEAFEGLVCAHSAKALAVSRHTLADTALAEDAVQEAFVKVIRYREQCFVGVRGRLYWSSGHCCCA